MSEPANDPPLVLRPEQAAEAPPAPAPKRPRPGFWEAVLWCLVFMAGQMCGAFATVCVVFAAYAINAPNPTQFAFDQLDQFQKAADPKGQGERPVMPFEFGQALAYGMLAAQIVSLGIIALVLPRRIGPNWKRQIGVRRPAGLHVLIVLMLVPGFMLTADAIQTTFLWATDMKPPTVTKALNGVFSKFPWPLTVLAVALGPGVVEELWCRGFLGRGLSARYGLVTGVLLTSFLFALMHLDPTQLLVFTLMGAYLHFVYIATRSIWIPILLHAMNNGIAVLLVLVLPPEKFDQPTPIIVPLVSLAVMIFGSVALWTSRVTLQPVLTKDDAWWESDGWRPEYPGVSAPPEGANVRLEHELLSPVAMLFTIVSFGVLLFLGYKYVI
jgi:uncharacterized protein